MNRLNPFHSSTILLSEGVAVWVGVRMNEWETHTDPPTSSIVHKPTGDEFRHNFRTKIQHNEQRFEAYATHCTAFI